jgi:hypothetical protein
MSLFLPDDQALPVGFLVCDPARMLDYRKMCCYKVAAALVEIQLVCIQPGLDQQILDRPTLKVNMQRASAIIHCRIDRSVQATLVKNGNESG